MGENYILNRVLMENKDLCTGCEACRIVCPHNCIHMKYDEEGFLQPVVDGTKCRDCGLCGQVCPVINCEREIKKQHEQEKYILGYALDSEKRIKSSSGGIFPLLAELFLKNGGVIYGSAYDREFRVRHIEVDNLQDLQRLRGSKYVQSRINSIYKRVKTQLDIGRTVLFSGTGCQIAGLKNYLKKDYKNLYSVAIICHGAPSPGVWSCYKKQYKSIRSINFRDKTYGWKKIHLEVTSENGKKIIPGIEDPFYHAFLKNIILRKACYDCRFKGTLSQADIMIGDAWGVEYYARSFDDDKGTSIMISYTDKGSELIQQIKPYIKWKEMDSKLPCKYNQRIKTSVAFNPDRNVFFKLIKYIPVKMALKIFVWKGKYKMKK